MFLTRILNYFEDQSGLASVIKEISQTSDYWPSQTSFDRIEKEYCSLQNRWKIDLLTVTNVPILGDVIYIGYRAVIFLWRLIFCPKRQTPSIGNQDTILCDQDGKIRSQHSDNITQCKSFKDYQILWIHNLTSSISLTQEDTSSDSTFLKIQPIKIQRDETGRFVLLQTGIRACTAAVSAMLILDAGKKCSIAELRTRNLGDEGIICSDLKAAGLKPLFNRVTSIQELRKLVNTNGSAIIDANSGIGGHVIIVDEIGRNVAKIRDPFHGWSIIVPTSSLSIRSISVVQAKK